MNAAARPVVQIQKGSERICVSETLRDACARKDACCTNVCIVSASSPPSANPGSAQLTMFKREPGLIREPAASARVLSSGTLPGARCSGRSTRLSASKPRLPPASFFLIWTRSGERRGNATHGPREVRPGSSLYVHFLGSTARPPTGLLLGVPPPPSFPERLGSHDLPTPAPFRLQGLAGQGQQPALLSAASTPLGWVAYADRAKGESPGHQTQRRVNATAHPETHRGETGGNCRGV